MAEEGATDKEASDLDGVGCSAEASAGFRRNMVSRSIFLPFFTPFSTHSTVTQEFSLLNSVIRARWIRPSLRWIATQMPTWTSRKRDFTVFKDERLGATGRHNWLAMVNDGGVRAHFQRSLRFEQQDLSLSQPEFPRVLSALAFAPAFVSPEYQGSAWGHSRHKGNGEKGDRAEGL